SQFTYSVTNRILARTTSGPDAEPVRWEAVRAVVGHSIDLRSRTHTIDDIIGDLIVQAPSIFRMRVEIRYSLDTHELVTATTDLPVTAARVTGSVGPRFVAEQRTNFLQGTLRAELTNHIVAHVATNWDMRTDAFVENRFGVDLRFQCYEFSLI